MSEFEDAVLDVLRALEWGEVVTYGEVAEMAGYPGRGRGVAANSRNYRRGPPLVARGRRRQGPSVTAPDLQAHLLSLEQRSS